MATAATAFEYASGSSVVAAGVHEFTKEVSPNRLQEFEDILSHSLPRLRRIAMRSLRNPEDAEDAVQEAMLSAFTHITRFDGRAQMFTWLTAIVVNAVRMQIRRRPRGQMLSLDQSLDGSQRNVSEVLADPRPTPEEKFERQELRELVNKMTASLPAPQRAAMRLRIQEDLSIQKTAKALGVPEGTVKAQLARGRTKLIERFHKVTAKSRIKFSSTTAKTKHEVPSEVGREHAQGVVDLPVAVLARRGEYNGWIGA